MDLRSSVWLDSFFSWLLWGESATAAVSADHNLPGLIQHFWVQHAIYCEPVFLLCVSCSYAWQHWLSSVVAGSRSTSCW